MGRAARLLHHRRYHQPWSLCRVGAEIFTYDSLTIELNNASEEVAKYEVVHKFYKPLDQTRVHVTDEQRHDQAKTRLDKAHRLVQEEAGTLGAASNSPLKKAPLAKVHPMAKHVATKAVSPSPETMRAI